MRPPRTFVALAGAALILTLNSAPAQGAPERVPDDFFGMNYPSLAEDHAALRQVHLNAIKSSGIDELRVTVHWNEIEATAPVNGVHSWRFVRPDSWIADASRAGLKPQITFAYTPPWASGITNGEKLVCDSFNAVSHQPHDPNAFALAMRQMVLRYGPDGSFWSENPGIPKRPVRIWEVWNEQNLASYWCPKPHPPLYADLFVLSARAIKAVDPNATVVLGGMTLQSPSGTAYAPGEFLLAATTRQPAIRTLADAVGIHVYPFQTPDRQLEVIALFRQQMRRGTIPDTTPMIANEIGWTTSGRWPVTEAERAIRYERMTKELPRTNCNVAGMMPYAWTTRERDPGTETDFYGIANPATGALHPAGVAHVNAVALMRGKTSQSPPTAQINTCAGMPDLDRDSDGVPDEDDEFPTDPDRTGSPPPGGGGGGSGGGGSGDSLRCSTRLAELTRLVATTEGAEQVEAKRRYRSAQRRCVPCIRKQARLKRKIASAPQERAVVLRSRARRVRKRCAPCTRRLERIQRATLVAGPSEYASLLKRHDKVRRRCR
jgi:hypothetical protein